MRIRKTVCLFINRFRHKTKMLRTPYAIKLCNGLPDIINDKLIYISHNNINEVYIGMQCPCKCGDIIDLNLVTNRKPCWTISWNLLGTITVRPSIWRTRKCRSHFFIENNKIRWCKDKNLAEYID